MGEGGGHISAIKTDIIATSEQTILANIYKQGVLKLPNLVKHTQGCKHLIHLAAIVCC